MRYSQAVRLSTKSLLSLHLVILLLIVLPCSGITQLLSVIHKFVVLINGVFRDRRGRALTLELTSSRIDQHARLVETKNRLMLDEQLLALEIGIHSPPEKPCLDKKRSRE